MDLLALVNTLRRHKLIVLLVLLIAAGGNGYVAFGVPPQYESQAQFVLIAPPAPPSDAAIERDPELAKHNTNNPYLRLPNPVVVVEVLAQRVSGDAIRRELIAQGADQNYTISSTNAIGSGLVISVVGTGTSAEAAGRTLDLVTTRMQAELRAMQKVDGADDRYLFQALPINPPTEPIRKVTGTFRSLIAVSAACVVLLFGLISVADAIGPRRPGRPGRARSADPTAAADDATPAADGPPPASDGPAPVAGSPTSANAGPAPAVDGPASAIDDLAGGRRGAGNRRTDSPAAANASATVPVIDGRTYDSSDAGSHTGNGRSGPRDQLATEDISTD